MVIGLGLSGVAAANLLNKEGARVFVIDKKPRKELSKTIKKLREGVRLIPGYSVSGSAIIKPDFTDMLVISPGVNPDDPLVKQAEKIKIPVSGELEVACSLMPETKVVAVTGTNGKTTTVELVKAILGTQKKRRSLAVGNIGLPLSACLDRINDRTDVVIEVSSYQLETVRTFHPYVSVITNITPDHLERHKNMNGYIRAKAKIFSRQSKEDCCILNADDRNCLDLAGRVRCRRVMFSRKKKLRKGVFIKGNRIVCNTGFTPELEFSLLPGFTRLPGPHNLENIMAGIAVGSIFGLSEASIGKAISSFRGVEHRLETVRKINGVKFINDSKSTNVQSCRTALDTFSKDIILIMGGRGKGLPYLPLKKSIKKKVKTLIVFGEAAAEIEGELKGSTKIFTVMDVKRAVGLAYSTAEQGCTVLFSPACSSFDRYKNFEERGREFKKWVRRLQ